MELAKSKLLCQDENFKKPDKFVSFHVPCYVCGELTKGLYMLFARKNYQKHSYFPFIETYKPPKSALPMTADGSIGACLCCFAFLNCQWDLYENRKVPYTKRIYWLKRTDGKPFSGIMVGPQTEYASQILGLSSEQVPESLEGNILKDNVFGNVKCLVNVKDKSPTLYDNIKVELDKYSDIEIQSEALDLSLENKNESLETNSMTENVNSSRINCCICGNKSCVNYSRNMSSVSRFGKIKYNLKLPFAEISFYEDNKVNSFDADKNIKVCENCLSRLYAFYNFKGIKDELRNYYLKGHYNSKSFGTCVACNSSIINLRNTILNEATNTSHSSSDSSPISPKSSDSFDKNLLTTEREQVQLCCNCLQLMCCDAVVNTKMCPSDCCLANKTFDQNYNNRKVYEKCLAASVTGEDIILPCDLCSSNATFKDMEKLCITADRKNLKKNFPLRYLTLLGINNIFIDYILSCQRCCTILYTSNLSNNSEASSNNLCNILSCLASIFCEISMEPSSKRIKYSQALIHEQEAESKMTKDIVKLKDKIDDNKLIECVAIGTTTITFHFINEVWEPQLEQFEMKPFKSEGLRLPVISLGHPLDIGVNCFICKNFSNPGSTYVMQNIHFTPFKINCQSNWKNREVGLICSICFHALVSQRQEFEIGNIPYCERKYIMSWYFCYVCSAGTFRDRLHLLPVKDFPFLLKHVSAKKGIVANDGKDVIICRDCYETLNSQYLEMERLRVPVEMRQYNWIKRPPPHE